MKCIIACLMSVCAFIAFAVENPTSTIRNTAVADMDGVLATLANNAEIMKSPALKMNLAVANGLVYLQKTDAPSWDTYIKIVQDKAKEFGVEDKLATSNAMFNVIRNWSIGKKSVALVTPAIAYIEASNNPVFAESAAQLSYDVKKYEDCLKWAAKMATPSRHACMSYFQLGLIDEGIEYYYSGLEKEQWNPNDARDLFNTTWKGVLKKYGDNAAELAKFKARNAKYASQYTTKLYDVAEPNKSPWRPLVVILTAQSK